jgi:4-hydroxybenzoate polyprenyltransferase
VSGGADTASIPRSPGPPVPGVDGQVLRGTSRLAAYANFVKVAHTVFALPFVAVGVSAAALTHAVPWGDIGLAVVAFTAARFAAMGFNRIVDRRFDALNPRTAGRELPSGRMRAWEAWALVGGMSLLFLVAAAAINPLCRALAPVALAWVLAYSYTKRFTALCHGWLGLSLAIAPVGGYLTVTGAWSDPWWLLVLLAAGVASWVAGFDLLYSLQDEEFDREHRLVSGTTLLGAPEAIGVARLLHIVAIIAFTWFGRAAGFGSVFVAGIGLAAVVLMWEHRLVRPYEYARLDAAFFAMNGVISGVVMLGAVADVLL